MKSYSLCLQSCDKTRRRKRNANDEELDYVYFTGDEYDEIDQQRYQTSPCINASTDRQKRKRTKKNQNEGTTLKTNYVLLVIFLVTVIVNFLSF